MRVACRTAMIIISSVATTFTRLRIYFDGESFDNIPVTPDPTPDPDPEPEVDTNLNIAVQVVGWGPVVQRPVID